MGDLVGQRLGSYELREAVRRGGMSTVYKAWQPSLDRWVAVKVLSHPGDPQFAARFQLEARSIARLQHPNIIPIYDYGEQDGQLYLVVAYVESGRTLADLVGEPMEPVRAVELTMHFLAGLGYAHERGIVHRDVKPSNILLPSPVWPMLADFGIAKLLSSDQTQLTQQGLVVGTAAYMAPEQAFGLKVDARTDLYASGIVFYEMVTGRVPFEADTPVAALMKQAYEEPPPPRELNPDLPAEAERILLRALAKQPDDRYGSAAEMTDELRAVLADLQAPPSTSQAELLAITYEAGMRAFSAGRWDEALGHLTRVSAEDPGYEDVEAMLEAVVEARERGGSRPKTGAPAARVPPASGQAVAPAAPAASAPVAPAGAPPAAGAPPPAAGAPPARPARAPAAPAANATGPPAAPAAEAPAAEAPAVSVAGRPTPPVPAAEAPTPAVAPPAEGARAPERPGPPPGGRRARWRWPVVGAAGVVVVVLLTLLVPRWLDRGGASASGRWAKIADLPAPLEGAGVASFGGRLWVAGGVSPGEGRPLLQIVHVYDPGTGKWELGPLLPTPVSHAALVSTGNSLYLLGGLTGSGSVPTVFRLDLGRKNWERDVPLPQPRGAGAAAWDGSRIVFGGGVRPDHKAASEVWALEQGSWRLIGKLQKAREKLAATTDGFGTVWFLAGRDPTLSRQELGLVDVAQSTGVRASDRQVAPLQGAPAVWWPQAGVCLLGGQGPSGFTAEVKCLDDQGRGRQLPPLGQARAGLGAAVVGDTVYAVGGYGSGFHGTGASEAFRLDTGS
jgi:hypothetical protein